MKRSLLNTFLLLLSCFGCSLLLHAQEKGKFWGRVLDGNNQPIAGAIVSLESGGTTPTDRSGFFHFEHLPTWPLQLTVHAQQYADYSVFVEEKTYQDAVGLRIQLVETQYELEEVLVTVRRPNSYTTNSLSLGGKFQGRLKDLPQSVTLVTSELIQDRSAFYLNDIVSDLSGVTLASSYDDFIIRGFKSGYESGIRLVNGLRSGYGYGNAYYRSPMTLNLESIQILKGPGGSLFGDVVPGGTVNLVTKQPLEEPKAFVEFSVGSFDTYRTTIDIGGL